ncbi:MAG: sn-glycerol-3-phosphate ABC transporter ATP-binding protein UgpC [Proteobacteria bacterium]|nr:MAG: sn-glycerol-3-phosphate ABC transporter ATP-binding protein UgpC [Pseudomonadota bacterium]
MTTLTLNSLQKTYANGTHAVRGIDLEIFDGELTVFVGPSGCGKSTLLRMIAGLEEITSGDLMLDGSRINDVEPAHRDVAMVFQNYALYPHMTVRRNMSYALQNRKVPKAEIDRRVVEAARMLQLDELLERKPAQLSGGQRQRVAMGRAIVREPKLFLFDEPLSNLDAQLRAQMRVDIRKLQRQLRVTSIFVTHDQIEAMTVGDRLAVLNNGELEQIGTPMEVYSKPASEFVASFIGSPRINIVSGEVKAGTLHVDGFELPGFSQISDQPVKVGIRPEDFVLESTAKISLQIDLVEELGSDELLYCVSPTGLDYRIRRPGGSGHKVGENITVSVISEKLHLFSSQSGKRLN